MIRIAAVGDIHYDRDSQGRLLRYFPELRDQADMLLIAGDLTQMGTVEEISVLAADLALAPVPVIAVLGNHDYQSNLVPEITAVLRQSGVTVLEKSSTVLEVNGVRVGIVGQKGFGGGFIGACGSDFGEIEMKDFIRHTKSLAEALRADLSQLKADYRVVLLHYSPTPDTLFGEKKEIYPFLGSYLLAEAIDQEGADIVFHGHAHHGSEKGTTPGGIAVRNVAFPLIRHAFKVFKCAGKRDKFIEAQNTLETATV